VRVFLLRHVHHARNIDGSVEHVDQDAWTEGFVTVR
jgi:hypothetical protein